MTFFVENLAVSFFMSNFATPYYNSAHAHVKDFIHSYIIHF